MMIHFNYNTNFTSNKKLLATLHERSQRAKEHAPELSKFYDNSIKLLNKNLSTENYIKKTTVNINKIYNSNIPLDKKESYILSNFKLSTLYSPNGKITLKQIKDLLKVFTPRSVE